MPSKNYSVLLQLGRFLLNYKGTLVAAGCALVFTAGVTLAMGQGVKILIDDGFVAGSVNVNWYLRPFLFSLVAW
jgi:ATP-binding cassette subfamily B protein